MRCLASHLALAYLLILAVVAGCTSGSDVAQSPQSDTADARGEAAVDKTVSPAGISELKTYTDKDGLKTLIAPFTPPKLEELEKTVEWVEQPVVDTMQRLEDHLREQPTPNDDEAALSLRNDGAENNRKILAALDRLPENEGEVNWEAAITRHWRGDARTTNPVFYNSVEDGDISVLLHSYLFTFDWELKPFPDKAVVESWHSSKDGLYDKVVLRKDLTWSDGTPFTAHDVAFTFRTIMNPDVPALAVRSGTDELKWVEAYDDWTVVYFHKQALATNAVNLNFPTIPQHVYEKSLAEDPTLQKSPYHVEQQNNPVCSGAYTVARRQRGQEMVLRRRESYYLHDGKQVRDKPFFREVRFRVIEDGNVALLALKSGEVHDLEMNSEQWVSQTSSADFYEENTKATGLEWLYFAFEWNCASQYFDDRRVRMAMSYAFDHDEMLNVILYGLNEPCTGIFHPTAWMASKTPKAPFKQDLDKAEELLEAAGWDFRDGDNVRSKLIDGRKVPFDFTMITTNVPERVRICNLLAQNLNRIGIKCAVKPLERVTHTQLMVDKEFDATFGGWGTGTDPDLSENIWSTSAIDGGRNWIGYSNRYVDGLYQLAKQVESATEAREQIVKEFELDKIGVSPSATRAEAYGKIDDLLYADQPYTFLFYRSAFYGFNKQLRGYMFSPRGPYHYSPGFFSVWMTMQ
ncbi:MAG: ABC transporter substrate-binding protein [Pirellulales bacterium]